MEQEDNKDAKQEHQKKKAGIIISVIFGSIVLFVIFYSTFYSDPVMVMYQYTFDNGTQRWLEANQIINYDFKNGTKADITVENLVNHLQLKTSIQKVIHLKDGRTDYHYKHTDSIGSKTK